MVAAQLNKIMHHRLAICHIHHPGVNRAWINLGLENTYP